MQTQFTVSLCNIIISISAIILWFSWYVYIIYSYKYFFLFFVCRENPIPRSNSLWKCDRYPEWKTYRYLITQVFKLRLDECITVLFFVIWFWKYIFVSISQTYRQTYTCRTLISIEEVFFSLFVHNYLKINLEVYILVNKV